mmetsp:Transcript_54414/g.174468  ORF Transcript_54414/g.174468 Transcript_54414/m.174468 type:complete len:244 (-) Transcript_54414:34-765(-)
MLGARRVLLVDSLKPFIAAAAGGLIFGEGASPVGITAMACAVLGVLTVSLEREGGELDSCKRDQRALGYVLALVTVILDVGGSVLTKGFGQGLGPWTIGGLRFGFAAACMGLVYATCHRPSVRRRAKPGRKADLETAAASEDSSTLKQQRPGAHWCEMPTQSRRSWTRATAGAVFVTFLCPALGNHALFAIPLSLCLTLGSMSPVFSIPLVWLLKGERVSARAVAGSVVAVLGAAVFCSTTAW